MAGGMVMIRLANSGEYFCSKDLIEREDRNFGP